MLKVLALQSSGGFLSTQSPREFRVRPVAGMIFMRHTILIMLTVIMSIGATAQIASASTPEDVALLDRLHRHRVLEAALRALGPDAVKLGRIELKQLREFVVDHHWEDILRHVQKEFTQEACPYNNWGTKCSAIVFDPMEFQWRLEIEVQRIITEIYSAREGTVDSPQQAGIGADQILELLEEPLRTPAPLTVRDVLAMGEFHEPEKTSVPEARTPVAEPLFFGRLTNVRVRRSFLDRQGISLPANIGYSNKGRSDQARQDGADASSFSVRGALEWSPQFLHTRGKSRNVDSWAHAFHGLLVYEADVSSDPSEVRNSLRHRFGTRWVSGKVTDPTAWLSGFVLDSTLDFVTDRHYDASLYGLTTTLTPNMYPLGVGLPIQVSRSPVVSFRWRPYTSLNYAYVNDPGRSETFATIDDYLNLLFKVSAQFTFWNRIILTAEMTQTEELKSEKKSHSHFLTAGRLLLNDEGNLSLDLSYQMGELAPAFSSHDRFSVELGVKF